jgi:hypothetical protein
MPNDSEPSLGEGKVIHVADRESVTVGVPVFAERVEDLLDVVPLCTTEKDSDVGENDRAAGCVTVSVTFNVALAYPDAEAVTVAL